MSDTECTAEGIFNRLKTCLEKRVDELNESVPKNWSLSVNGLEAIILQESGIKGQPLMPCIVSCTAGEVSIHCPQRGESLTITPCWDQEKGEGRVSVRFVTDPPRKTLSSISLGELWNVVRGFLGPLFSSQ